jgi:hypothetical protein
MPPTGNGRSVSDRARTGGGVDAQDGLFDKVIEDGDLIAALERREEARARKLSATKAYKVEDDNAKSLLVNHDIQVGDTVRAGRFRLTKTAIAANHVEFDTSGSERLSIGTINEED